MKMITGVDILDEEIKENLRTENIYKIFNNFIFPLITEEERDFLVEYIYSIYRDLILNELQYRHVSLITVCQDPSKIYQKFISHSQTRVNLD